MLLTDRTSNKITNSIIITPKTKLKLWKIWAKREDSILIFFQNVISTI